MAGGAVLMLSGAVVGIVSAQAQPTPPAGQQAQERQNGYQAFIDALAKRLNVTSENLQTAIGQARTDAGVPAGGPGLPGFGHHGRGPAGVGGPRGGVDLGAAATALGISPDQLRTELPGKSLAQVAQAHGKSASDVATALKNAANARIDQAVSAGRISAADAATQKTQAAQRIDQLVNEVLPQRGPRP
jgi:hypothetical protein